MSATLLTVDAIAARANPDASQAPGGRIEAGTELIELERTGDWVRVETPAGDRWWVDGRRLTPTPAASVGTPPPPAPPPQAPPPPQVQLASTPPSSSPADTSRHFDRGLALVESGDLAGALDAFSNAIVERPDNSYAYSNRATCYMLIGGHEDAAVQDCNEAIRLEPANASAHAYRGLARCFRGDLSGALEDCNQAIRLDPASDRGYLHRGITYLNMGEAQSAATDFTRSLELSPNDYDAYFGRGKAYVALEELDSAVADFTRALELVPNDSDALNQRGMALTLSGSEKKAIRDFDQAIRVDPNDSFAHFLRACALLDRGKVERAFDDIGRAIQLDPQNPTYHATRGEWLRENDQPQQAIQDYDQAIRLAEVQPEPHGDLAEILTNRAVAFTDLGDTGRALTDCNAAIDIDPQYAFAYYVRGINSHMQGDAPAAIADLRRVLESDQEHLHEDALSRLHELGN